MTNSDLLDIHYFLAVDDDLDDDEFKEVFLYLLKHSPYQHARLRWGILILESSDRGKILL